MYVEADEWWVIARGCDERAWSIYIVLLFIVMAGWVSRYSVTRVTLCHERLWREERRTRPGPGSQLCDTLSAASRGAEREGWSHNTITLALPSHPVTSSNIRPEVTWDTQPSVITRDPWQVLMTSVWASEHTVCNCFEAKSSQLLYLTPTWSILWNQKSYFGNNKFLAIDEGTNTQQFNCRDL